MNCVIKLKHCNLTKIDSKFVEHSEVDYCFNGEYSEAIESKYTVQEITFTFDSICDQVVTFEVDKDYSSFTHIAEFFYNKDFSNVEKSEFLEMFQKHVRATISYPYKN